MLHIALHFLAPAVVALVFFRPRAEQATLVMLATMLVDLDHLLADPIYEAERCSIGFHPLHTTVPIAVYVAVFLLAVAFAKRLNSTDYAGSARIARLVSLGLLIHMVLDAIDCMSW